MTDSEKIQRLRIILSHQIQWYKTEIIAFGEDYVYDELYDEFNNLSRGDYMAIVALLI